MSGYTSCACRDCFDTAVSSDINKPELCSLCEEAGCNAEGHSECCVDSDMDNQASEEDLKYFPSESK